MRLKQPNTWLAPLITAVFTLVGVFAGNYLNQMNTYFLQEKKNIYEMQVESYSKLMGLKLAWSQAIETHSEADLLSQYYDSRSVIKGNRGDLEEAKRQNDRAIVLIQRVSDIQREVFQALGAVRIAFEPTAELETAVDAIYHFKTIVVRPPSPEVKTVHQLDEWKNRQDGLLSQFVKEEYENKFDPLLAELLRQIRARGRIA